MDTVLKSVLDTIYNSMEIAKDNGAIIFSMDISDGNIDDDVMIGIKDHKFSGWKLDCCLYDYMDSKYKLLMSKEI